MRYRIILLSCIMTFSPLCAMHKKIQDYLQKRYWKAQTPVFLKAAQEGDLDVLKAMLASGIDVNIKGDSSGEFCSSSALIIASNALMHKADQRQAHAIRLLVAHGADVNQINDIGYSAIEYAAFSIDRDSLLFLLKNSMNVHSCKNNRNPQEILERLQSTFPTKAPFLEECIEHVESGQARTIAEMVLIGQGLPDVANTIILPYIGHEETQKEREQTVQWLHQLRRRWVSNQ